MARIVRAAVVVLAVGLTAYLLAATLFETLDLSIADLLFRVRGSIEEEAPVVLVAIDDASFTQTGQQWPWPRDYLARLVDSIAAGNPRVIVLDILFYEATTPDQDGELARALANAGNVVLVNSISVDERGAYSSIRLNEPIPELDAVAVTGLTNFPHEVDGKVRRLLAFQSHNDQLLFSWSMQAARLYLGAADFDVRSSNEVWIAGQRVPLEDQFLRVNYRGPTGQTIDTVSAYQVAEGMIDPGRFADKIVIVGATTETLHDTYPTPFGADLPMPGAEINAHAIDTILSGRTLTPCCRSLRVLFALLAAGLGTWLTAHTRPLRGLALTAGLLAGYGIAAGLLFVLAQVIMPVVAPLLAVTLAFIANTSLQLYEEQRERARVRMLFDRYVSSAAIDQMLDQPGSVAPGGERREVTILFSDIRGFTSLSEALPPEELVKILNEYLGEMTEIIFKHRGTVDKFEGDAILAIWNAPLDVEDHAARAVRCALDMTHRLDQLQQQWAATGHVVLRNGIGINTGVCFVGNIGSARRMDYTVIGDAVNLAARLESLTKELGIPVLFTRQTQQQLTPDITAHYVTSAHVIGRKEPVDVFTIDPGTHDLKTDPGVDLDSIPTNFYQLGKH